MNKEQSSAKELRMIYC